MTGATDPGSVLQFIEFIAKASPAVIFISLLFALVKGWLILPRELISRDTRITELERERDEFKQMAFKSVGLGERVVTAAEERERLQLASLETRLAAIETRDRG